MSENLSRPATAFNGDRLLLAGPLADVAIAVERATESGAPGPLLVFDDATGRVIDLDLRGARAEIIEGLSQLPLSQSARASTPSGEEEAGQRGRGRPRLGVIAREVTLLPRHWDWLAAQPGGASSVLRKLVEEARRTGGAAQARRMAQEAAYSVMSAIAGDLPGFEEATRALFAGDHARLENQISAWPADIRAYVLRLAGVSFDQG